VIPKELLSENLTYLSMTGSLSLKQEETRQVEDKRRSDRPEKLPTADK